MGAVISNTSSRRAWARGADGRLEKQGQVVKLAITGPALKGADIADAYFFPLLRHGDRPRQAPGDRARPRGLTP